MTARQHCGNEDPHAPHRWGEEWADMGVIWFECEGVSS